MPSNLSSPFLPFDIQNSRIPQEGPKAIPIPMQMGTISAWLVDLTNTQQLGHISYVQTLFVDNSANANALTITTDVTNAAVIIPPRSQAFVPILQPNPPRLTVSTTLANILVTIYALNFPVSPAVWSTISTTPAFVFSGNNLLVSDTALDALVNTYNGFNALAVADQYLEAVYAGASMFSIISTNAAMVGNIKASAGKVRAIETFNNSAVIAYLKLYNTAGTPTAGAGTPVWRTLIPATPTPSGSGFIHDIPAGLNFTTGIGYAIVGGIADADATAIAAAAFLVNVAFQ